MTAKHMKTAYTSIMAATIAVAFLGTSTVCKASQHNETTSTGLAKLSVYNGTWKIKTTYFRTQYSKPHTDSIVLDTRCWNTPNYYVCNEVKNGKSSRLIIYTPDAGAHEFYAYFITQNGGHRTSGMKLSTAGKGWTYSAKLTAPDGKAVYDRITNTFKGPDAIDFKEKISLDGKHWTTMNEGHETRLKK